MTLLAGLIFFIQNLFSNCLGPSSHFLKQMSSQKWKKVKIIWFGALGRIRTPIAQVLSLSPLPIGLQGREMVGQDGFEPSTSCVSDKISYRTELLPYMAVPMGFEPMLLDWQSRVLDLTERWDRWVDGWDSNSQPSESQSDALPIELPSTWLPEPDSNQRPDD